MTSSGYNLGALVKLTFEIRDEDGVLYDLTVPRVVMVLPDGDIEVHTSGFTNPSVGIIEFYQIATLPGTWVGVVRDETYGGASADVIFAVNASRVPYPSAPYE